MGNDSPNKNEMTELHLAAYHGELDWVQNCIKGGLEVNARDDGGFTPLHWVVDMGMVGPDNGEREEIVRLLIEMGADVNAADDAGESVFFRAVMAGNYKIVKLLISANADINAMDSRGNTPLNLAIANEESEMARIIKQAGASSQTGRSHTHPK